MSLTQIVGASRASPRSARCSLIDARRRSGSGLGRAFRALETELATLEHDIRLLEDTKSIKRLQRAYGYYVDKKLSREIGALFADDPATRAELGGSGVYVGKERIAEFYDRIIGGEGLPARRALQSHDSPRRRAVAPMTASPQRAVGAH